MLIFTGAKRFNSALDNGDDQRPFGDILWFKISAGGHITFVEICPGDLLQECVDFIPRETPVQVAIFQGIYLLSSQQGIAFNNNRGDDDTELVVRYELG